MIRRLATLYLLMIAVSIAICWPVSPKPLAWVLLIAVAALGYSGWRVLRRQRDTLDSFELEISKDQITRRAAHQPETSLTRDSIASITQNRRGDIFIRGKARSNLIYVPRDLEDRTTFLELLSTYHQIGSAR